MYVHARTELGVRESNEDKELIVENLDGKSTLLAPINMYCVYDGHGGKDVSKFLYYNMYKFIMNKNNEYPLDKKIVNMCYDAIQNRLIKTLGKKSAEVGSTALVVIMFQKEGKLYLQTINVGDSRAIINEDNVGVPITIDHKPDWIDEKTRIEKLGGKIKYDGTDWRIKGISVSRSFGDTSANPYITHRPKMKLIPLTMSHKFIVLACDGLWDVMSPQDVVNFILSRMVYEKKTKKLICLDIRENIAKSLAQYAIEKLKSQDNVSIIIVFL